jgi:hypothetical protein
MHLRMTTMTNPRRCRFVRYGLATAGIVAAGLLLTGILAWRLNKGPVFLWAMNLLCGPLPPLLVHFDFTDAQLRLLGPPTVVFYWCILGVASGLCAWRGYSRLGPEGGAERLGRYVWRIRWSVLLAALVGGLLSLSLWPSYVSSGRAPDKEIINNLRQIDAAKEQLALDKRLPHGQVVTEADLAPYLKYGRDFLTACRVGTERYVLNPIGVDPYAVFDSAWRVRRRGWREGYTIPKGTIVHLQ